MQIVFEKEDMICSRKQPGVVIHVFERIGDAMKIVATGLPCFRVDEFIGTGKKQKRGGSLQPGAIVRDEASPPGQAAIGFIASGRAGLGFSKGSGTV